MTATYNPFETTKEIAVRVFGETAVANYHRVKAFYMAFGHALERTFARAVGGTLGGTGHPDVITRLASWEFCASSNGKNASGAAADLERVGRGHLVQATGIPRPGWISGVEFLELHGIADPYLVACQCQAEALNQVRATGDHRQLWEAE